MNTVDPQGDLPYSQLLDSFFMGGSGDVSSQSSTTATVSGPVSSREVRETAVGRPPSYIFIPTGDQTTTYHVCKLKISL